MTGREYLQRIKAELEAGRRQHKMGASILAAFGYLRRRQTATSAVNRQLRALGLKANPPIDANMPLTVPRIRFKLSKASKLSKALPANRIPNAAEDEAQVPEEEEEAESTTTGGLTSGFKVAELAAANKDVAFVRPTDTVSKAYTVMCSKKYSQLVVADAAHPLSTAIKGIISYQSITNALLHGSSTLVKDCLDPTTPQVTTEHDISAAIGYLREHDVVLVIGQDKRLCGIVTAWDLADEFASLVGPFKWIGDIESRIRTIVERKLGREAILAFLSKGEPISMIRDLKLLTIGDLLRIIQNPEHWEKLHLPYEREEFSKSLDGVRDMRNRLMHFRDPLNEGELAVLKNFRRMVEIVRLPEIG